MKNTQKQNKKAIYWGVLTFLTGAGLLFNVNHSQVEAIDLSNSHLGTFEGNTTFTTSSGTGVQPTLAIEVKNQDGSTQSYETSSGSLTIPNTQEGATIKSAILKGETLVNLMNENERFNASLDGTNPSYWAYKYFTLTQNLKPSTNYTLIFNATITQSHIIHIGGKPGNAFYSTSLSNVANGVNKFLLKTYSEITDKEMNKLFIQSNNSKLVEITLTDFILVEGDYTNTDIPYFTGMQSVKLPVLTITNGESEQIENEKGQLIPNPSFKSTTIRFEEEVILRSNGEVYDELDLMTGKLTQRLDEKNEVLAKPIVRAVKMKAEPVFKIVNQAEVSVVGEVKPTMVSVTVPTAPLSFVLDPNKEPDQQFIASEFSLTNDGQAPLTIELKEFVQTTTIFKDVMPDYYESWDYLTKEESKSIALGLVPQESENWLSFNPGIYYAADRQNKVIGRVKQKSTVDFEFTALHGPSFESLPNPQYRLTFVFGF